jgi:hypothetical protein
MLRALFGLLSLTLLPSCAQWPQIVGQYGQRLTYGDVLELRAIVRQRHDIEKPIYRISMFYDADRAYVECGEPTPDRPVATSFTAYERDGRWIIDEKSIHKIDLIITRELEKRSNQSLEPTAGRCEVHV